MSKIVRLTESDLIRLVKRVLKEHELDSLDMGTEMPKRHFMKMKPENRGILGHRDSWFDEDDRPVDPEEFDYDEEIEFGPDDFEMYKNITQRDVPRNKWSFGQEDRVGSDISKPGRDYWNRYQKDGPIKLRTKKRF